MSNKLKIILGTILLLIFANFSSVFAITINYQDYNKIQYTSDFDLDYFLDNSALKPLLGQDNLDSIKENEVVQMFKTDCAEDNYKYITILTEGLYTFISSNDRGYVFNGYWFLLHNEPIYSTRCR